MDSWTTIRTFSSTSADAGSAPDPSLGISVPRSAPIIEFRFASLVLSGSPTSVTFSFWRIEGTRVDLLGSISIPAASAACPPPLRFAHGADKYFVTVGFSGGTAPAIASGSIEVRPAAGVQPNAEAPASPASLPLPTGAATERTLATAAPGAATVPVNISSADFALTGGASFTLIVGKSGAVTIDDAAGHTGVVIPAMPDGYVHPGLVTKVYKSGTEGTNMMAVY